jgi:response regulator RpfG family c-di-GMP phosphodiesterase
MFTLLFVDDDQDILQFYAEALQDEMGLNVIKASSGLAAIDALKSIPIDIIVCDFNMPQMKGDDVYLFVRQNFAHIPFILFSTVNLFDHKKLNDLYLSHPANAQLIKPIDIQEMILTIKQSLEISYENKKLPETINIPTHLNGQLTPFPINIFLRFNNSPCEIFLEESPGQFKQVLKEKTKSLDTIYKLLQKNIDTLFVPAHQTPKFIRSLEKITIDFFNIEKSGIESQFIKQTHEIIHTCFSALEIQPESLIVTQRLVSATFDTIKQNKKLANFLQKLTIGENPLYLRSMLLSYLNTHIIENSEWDTQINKESLIAASILHDLLLPSPFLCTIENLDSAEYLNLRHEGQKLVKYHPSNMTQILMNSLPVVPMNAAKIIWQHHEKPDGTGFPKGIKEKDFNDLSRLFVISYEVVKMILKNDHQLPDFQLIKNTLETKFGEFHTFKYPLQLTLKFLQS